jgi:ACS family glucarate transporter-like MFS transporter
MVPIESPTRVRWTILTLLIGFSLVSYVERVNISIAAKLIKPELGIDDIQIGHVFSSFMLGYALFQAPAGRLGDRWGPRRVLAFAGISWGVLTVLTGLLAGTLFTAGVAFVALLLLRFALGVGESATYPVAARSVANWFPIAERGRANAMVIGGLSIGSAATPPLISWLMVNFGWHKAFYIVSIFAFLIAFLWWRYATDDPQEHGGVNHAELRLITNDSGVDHRIGTHRAAWGSLFKNREIVLLCVSYFFMNYVFYIFAFWLFLYLTEARGFSVLSGGIFASLPWIVSLVLTPVGGYASDKLSTRVGLRWGRSGIAVAGLILAALFLAMGATVNNAYFAVAALALCVGFLEFTEGPYWAATIDVARIHAGAATGILNMGGNLGGVVSTLATPLLKKYFGWGGSLAIGALLSLLSAAIWLWIRADRYQGKDFEAYRHEETHNPVSREVLILEGG